jgi:hypothetical protein
MARRCEDVAMNSKFREISKTSKILLPLLLASGLAACQGSNIGSSLENAIAPASPSPAIPEPITTKSASSPSPISSPVNSPVNTLASDRFTNQIKAIVLPSSKSSQTLTAEKDLLKSTSKSPSIELAYIDFTKPQITKSQAQINEFSDLEQAPAALRPWIKDLNQLGTIAPKTGQNFQPNILVARREYARWLLQTNNRLYKNQPSRQIRLAQPNDSASYPDIPNNHPDFAIIQGLANAGLINSTGDRFSPNDPILREELVQWKIPLDLRQPLPNATLETVNQVWGFKDSDRIGESYLSAIFADAQLRDLSNIRRSFGFTTLLQPQKPVTRAEAAASLWYFGTATDGLSASKVLEQDKL